MHTLMELVCIMHTLMELVGIDDEELSSRGNRLPATIERTALGELVQVTFGAERLLIFHAV